MFDLPALVDPPDGPEQAVAQQMRGSELELGRDLLTARRVGTEEDY